MNAPQTEHLKPARWPEAIAPSRWAARLANTRFDDAAIVLIGMPDDAGVGLNGGRLGAKLGPQAIREALSRYGTAEPYGFEWPTIFDAGDVTPAGADLHETHRRVTQATRAIMDAGKFPIGLGGGHDLTFPFVRGVAEHLQHRGPMRGVYFDAHLDVRESDGSGMPFRRLIEGVYCDGLEVVGLDPLANSREHTDWFCAHNGGINRLRRGDWPHGDVFVSFDLDVIDQSCAPGVSAMNPAGWDSQTACDWVREAGRCERVRCFDVMELSPPNDESGRTARLAAKLVLEFIRGYSERGGHQ